MTSAAMEQVRERLHDAGIRLVASLPDTWVANLIDAIREDERFTHVGVSREESAIGICSGAFLGGQRSAAVMGTSGFMASIYAIMKINYSYEIGFPIVMNLRGRPGDNTTHHVTNGLLAEPVLKALGVPYEYLETSSDIDRIPELAEYARVMKRPVAICLSQQLWKAK